MYFVVHLKDPSYDIIVPKNWIKGIEDHWEKFVNHSLNKNQEFLCYFDPNALEINGCPTNDVTPLFTRMVDFAEEGLAEGCYLVKLIRFNSSFEGALSVVNSRRHVPPGLYNPRRLRERPIPDIDLEDETSEDDITNQVADDDDVSDDASDDGTANGGGIAAASATDTSFDSAGDDESQRIFEEVSLPENFLQNLVESLVEDDDPLGANQQPESVGTENVTHEDVFANNAAAEQALNINENNSREQMVSDLNVNSYQNREGIRNQDGSGQGSNAENANENDVSDNENSASDQSLEANENDLRVQLTNDVLGNADTSADSESAILVASSHNVIGNQNDAGIQYQDPGQDRSDVVLSDDVNSDIEESLTPNEIVERDIENASENDGNVIGQSLNTNVNDSREQLERDGMRVSMESDTNMACNQTYEGIQNENENNACEKAGNADGLSLDTNESVVSVAPSPNGNQNYGGDLYADSINSSAKETKPEVVTFIEQSSLNQSEIDNLLDEPEFEVTEYDDLTMTVNLKTGLPKPVGLDEEMPIKYENDKVSGNIPYAKKIENETEVRIYLIGKKKVKLSAKMIERFTEWNTIHGMDSSQAREYDERMTIALLLLCVSVADIARHEIPAEAKSFIHDFLAARTADVDRLNKIDDYIYKYGEIKARALSAVATKTSKNM